MNGARSISMRKGYLLTALAAAVLLAASSGTAWAQVSIGFTESSGSIKENALLDADALNAPQMITVRVDGITAANAADVGTMIGTVTVQATGVAMAEVGADGSLGTIGDSVTVTNSRFTTRNSDVVLLVVQDNEDDADDGGAKDGNWVNEMIQVKLNATGTAGLGTNIFNLTIEDQDVAPVVKFDTSSVMLNEGNVRTVALDVHAGDRRAGIPAGVADIENAVVVRVSNHNMVMIGDCPVSTHRDYGKYSIGITEDDAWVTSELASTGLIQTADQFMIDDLADLVGEGDTATTTSAMDDDHSLRRRGRYQGS